MLQASSRVHSVSLRMNHMQPEQLFKWVEIAIVMKERMAFEYAERLQ